MREDEGRSGLMAQGAGAGPILGVPRRVAALAARRREIVAAGARDGDVSGQIGRTLVGDGEGAGRSGRLHRSVEDARRLEHGRRHVVSGLGVTHLARAVSLMSGVIEAACPGRRDGRVAASALGIGERRRRSLRKCDMPRKCATTSPSTENLWARRTG